MALHPHALWPCTPMLYGLAPLCSSVLGPDLTFFIWWILSRQDKVKNLRLKSIYQQTPDEVEQSKNLSFEKASTASVRLVT